MIAGPPWEARCHCGRLRLTIAVAPVHVCNCTRCQNATGSVGGWNGWFAKAGVTVTGRATQYSYDRTDGPESWQCVSARFVDQAGMA